LDVSNLFPGASTNFYLIKGGFVQPTLKIPSIIKDLNLNDNILFFPLLWVSNVPGVIFNITVTSSDTSVLPDPIVYPYDYGLVPTIPIRIHVVFECTGLASSVPSSVSVNITLMNNETGEYYCPIFFNFGKDCSFKTMISQEMREEFLMIEYYNETSIPDYVGCNITNGTENVTVKPLILVPLLSSLVPSFVILICVMVMVLVGWGVLYRRLKKRQRERILELEAVGIAYQEGRARWSPSDREPHQREFPVNKLKIKRELGQGAFGKVYEGEAEGIKEEGVVTPVAVKQLHLPEASDDFFREVAFMSELNHPNVIRLLGVCSLNEPFAMIVEYMDLGDLCSFLRDAALLRNDDNSDDDILQPSEMTAIAMQIARGMEYIASVSLVHRDLATRNCLVSTGLIVKIGDFGMSRSLYYTDYYKVSGSTLLPIRWMAPESISYGEFSEASDVYSFGVLLWEIFNYGEQPYAGHSNDEVLQMIMRGRHLEIDNHCPLRQVMIDCWQRKIRNRPTFSELCRHLSTIIHDMTTHN
jgi:hypothetical protein